MKKIYLFTTEENRQTLLNKLRSLGLFHLHPLPQKGSMARKEAIEKDLEEKKKILFFLKKLKESPSFSEALPANLEASIRDLSHEKKEREKSLDELRKEKILFEKLGTFDPAHIQSLREKGLEIQIFHSTEIHWSKIASGLCCEIFLQEGPEIWAVTFSQGKRLHLSCKEIALPTRNWEELKSQIQREEEKLKKVAEEIKNLSRYTDSLIKKIDSLERELEDEKIFLSTQKDGKIQCLEGYCPQRELPILARRAEAEGWGLSFRDPQEGDEPPTLLEPSGWLKMGLPLYGLVNIVPGYWEADVTFPFLFYMGIFFAIIVGDGGYGLLFLLSTAILQRKFKEVPSSFFHLGYFFGAFTLFWGMVTGNWFGIESSFEIFPFLSTFSIPSLNAFSSESQSFTMMLCFIIGATHISLAHVIRAFRSKKPRQVLVQIGWIFIIVGIFYLVCSLVLSHPMPFFAYLSFGIGLVMLILFGLSPKNPLKGLALGMITLPLSLISSFSDIISYIRLFAVGMASLAFAKSFNEIAALLGFGSFATALGSALILAVGHGVNIAMAFLSVVVHGIRLNMLEFSSHMDMRWDGVEYHPLQEEKRS